MVNVVVDGVMCDVIYWSMIYDENDDADNNVGGWNNFSSDPDDEDDGL